MKTSKIQIRKDLRKDDFIYATEDEAQCLISKNKKYDSISCNTRHEENATFIFIEDEWRQVNNIDFE